MESESTIHTEKPNIPTAWNEANIINSALDAAEISRDEASNIVYEQLMPRILHTKMFVELPKERRKEMGDISEGQALLNILLETDENEKTVIDILAENGMSLSIAMQEGFEKDELLIQSLKLLNNAGINPTLWVVLPDEIGYWTNKVNVKETQEKMEAIMYWVINHGIDIDKIGLDYEPPIEIFQAFENGKPIDFIRRTRKYNKRVDEIEEELEKTTQEYMDHFITKFMKKYNIGIETYVPMKILRWFSNRIGLTLQVNEGSDIVPITYTSAYPFGLFRDRVLNLLDENDIPALGIVGNSPGKNLVKDEDGNMKPEKNLTKDELISDFRKIFQGNNPFRTHYVFALDSAETLNMVLSARNNALQKNIPI